MKPKLDKRLRSAVVKRRPEWSSKFTAQDTKGKYKITDHQAAEMGSSVCPVLVACWHPLRHLGGIPLHPEEPAWGGLGRVTRMHPASGSGMSSSEEAQQQTQNIRLSSGLGTPWCPFVRAAGSGKWSSGAPRNVISLNLKRQPVTSLTSNCLPH